MANLSNGRDLLNEFKTLIIGLNTIAPDIAELDLKNNLDASRRVLIGMNKWEKEFDNYRKKIKALRSEMISKRQNDRR
jgi:hypothetical protein